MFYRYCQDYVAQNKGVSWVMISIMGVLKPNCQVKGMALFHPHPSVKSLNSSCEWKREGQGERVSGCVRSFGGRHCADRPAVATVHGQRGLAPSSGLQRGDQPLPQRLASD